MSLPIDELRTLTPPARFEHAREEIGTAISTCERNGISAEAISTALLAVLMPRLVAAYGPKGTAAMLARLADIMGQLNATRQ